MLSTHDDIEAYSDNPSGFLALNTGNEYYRDKQARGLVAYRRSGRHLVQFGGVFAPPSDQAQLLQSFLGFARDQRRRVVAVQLQRADAELYAGEGFTVNQMGASYALRLDSFSLHGTKFMRLRNKISRARRSGLVVTEEDPTTVLPILRELDRLWLKSKGSHTKELTFLIGELGGEFTKHRRLFVGRIAGEVIGYISYSPVYGTQPGWLHDLTRRRPDAPPGVMEAINATAIERMRKEEQPWLHLGFTPFTGLDRTHAVASASRMVDRVVGLLAKHGDRIYPAKSQLAYKEKWGCDLVLPEYVAFQGGPTPGAIWQLLRITNSI
jgi:lysylphosphatidylglycerol synthetase-like protein (DUF2156 family)